VLPCAFLLLARDAAIFLVFAFSRRPRRVEAAALFYLILLYGVLPWLLRLAGLRSVAELILPPVFDRPGFAVAVAAVQCALAWSASGGAGARIKRSRPADEIRSLHCRRRNPRRKKDGQAFSVLVAALARRGLRLAWAQYLGDDPVHLAATLKRSLASGEIVFSFGGIGATPDDHTRQSAAAALGVGLRLHPEAEREIRARFPGQEATPQRLKMGEFPEGASIIPNPVNRIPGFRCASNTSSPVSRRCTADVEWVLDTRYRALFDRDRWSEASILVYRAGESQLISVMESIERKYAKLKVFSLPHGRRRQPDHVELGIRGDPQRSATRLPRCERRYAKPDFHTKDTQKKARRKAASITSFSFLRLGGLSA